MAPSSNGTARERPSVALLVLLVLAVIALGVDLVDGDLLKAVGTAGLVIGSLGAWGYRATGNRLLYVVAILGFGLFAVLLAYRAALHFGWLGH